MENVLPLKRFGQNYLRDNNILNKIIKEIAPLRGDLIIEIGPGTGALTSKLSESDAEIIAVEIDKRVKEELTERFHNVKILNEDFLKTDLYKIFSLANKRLRIAGNIPYNLTSPIIFKLIENYNIIKDAVFMVQYEVARRIMAGKGSKEYSILSVLLKYFSDTRFCFKVSPNVFYPRPKVYSAVIHIFMKNHHIDDELKKAFTEIVKASFGKRRKTLKNSLRESIFGDIDFTGSGIDLTLRAEQLDIKDFETLALFVLNHPLHNSGK
jgi:16S rRNA (adenine1518-N6/adenine1519-N6)-dimethyltransferase